METVNTQRRGFLKMASAASLGAMVLVTLKTKPSYAAAGNVKAKISENHGHSFAIALSKLESNGPTTYNIQGSSGHPHEIDVTHADIQSLVSGQSVELESSSDAGHSHTVLLQVI